LIKEYRKTIRKIEKERERERERERDEILINKKFDNLI